MQVREREAAMLVEGSARLANYTDAVEPYIRRSEWFACCFVYYAANDGLIHRASDLLLIDLKRRFIWTHNEMFDCEPPAKSRFGQVHSLDAMGR